MKKPKPKRKAKVKRSWLTGRKLPLALVGTVLALFATVWKMDDHWLPREIHNIAMAQVGGVLEKMQKAMEVQEARNQEFYWQRREAELRAELRKNPRDPQLLRDYQEAVDERRRCQDQMKKK